MVFLAVAWQAILPKEFAGKKAGKLLAGRTRARTAFPALVAAGALAAASAFGAAGELPVASFSALSPEAALPKSA